MKKLIGILVALIIAGCSQGGDKPGNVGFASISPQEAGKLIESRKDILVVDCRSPQELAEGAVPGSTLIPVWAIMQGNHNLPKNRPLLLVCAVGGRSFAAGQLLARNGYPEVYNLSGGLSAWKQAGLPLVYPQQQQAGR
jgi:rhodanese-related sulfurtransferase